MNKFEIVIPIYDLRGFEDLSDILNSILKVGYVCFIRCENSKSMSGNNSKHYYLVIRKER